VVTVAEWLPKTSDLEKVMVPPFFMSIEFGALLASVPGEVTIIPPLFNVNPPVKVLAPDNVSVPLPSFTNAVVPDPFPMAPE
jgi:hypothetical protein